MSMNIFGGISSLEKQLDYHLARHGVLAGNLANAETPGFREKELLFSDELGQAERMLGTHERHIVTPGDKLNLVVEQVQTAAGEPDEVRLERAMAKISANRLRFETSVELVRRRLALLRYAAGSGGQ